MIRLIFTLRQVTSAHPARIGTLAGWFQQGCGMMVALLLIPVVTRFLSPAEAGIWFAFQGLIAMIALLDLGFGFAISRQAAFTLGSNSSTLVKDDFLHLASGWTGVAQLFLLTRVLYRWLALAAVACGILLFEIFTNVGNLVPAGTPGVRWCWYAMVLASCFLVLTAGYSAFLNGIGAVYQTRFLAGLYQLGAGAGAAYAAWMGWGLPAMGASFAICAIFFRFAIGAVGSFSTRPMRDAPRVAPPNGSLRRLARAALPVGGVNVFGSLIFTVQSPLLGMILGPEKVAPFYLAQRIGLALNMLAMQTFQPQLPFFTRALGAGDIVGARALMRRAILRTTLLVALTSFAFFLLSPWAAHILLQRTDFIDSWTLFLMALDFFVLGATVIWGQFVLASGRNPFVISTILTGVGSLTLSLLLVPHLDIFGLPLATLVAGIIFNYRKCITTGLTLYNSYVIKYER